MIVFDRHIYAEMIVFRTKSDIQGGERTRDLPTRKGQKSNPCLQKSLILLRF